MTAYQPSDDVAALLKAYEDAEEVAEHARIALREGIAQELKDHPELTNDVMADQLPWTRRKPWTGETVRGIAREYDVPRKRKPTVRSIKTTRKRTTGS